VLHSFPFAIWNHLPAHKFCIEQPSFGFTHAYYNPDA
jgi:hypothetical protein